MLYTDRQNEFICPHFFFCAVRLDEVGVVRDLTTNLDYHLLIYAICVDNEMNKRIHPCILLVIQSVSGLYSYDIFLSFDSNYRHMTDKRTHKLIIQRFFISPSDYHFACDMFICEN